MSTLEDAREFGEHVKHGGWRLGLLVARSVEKGVGWGQSTKPLDREVSEEHKISLSEFARRSATTASRVTRYLDGWERAADAGHVPHAVELTPGQGVSLPDAEALPWSKFYDATESGGRPRDSKAEDAVKIIERRGVEAVVDVMPEDMQRETFVVLSTLIEKQQPQARIRDNDERLRAGVLLAALWAADSKLRHALSAVRDGEVDRFDDDDRQRLHIIADRMRRALDMLDMAAGAGIDDAELEAWLNDDAKGGKS